jgi:hypothetical protein
MWISGLNLCWRCFLHETESALNSNMGLILTPNDKAKLGKLVVDLETAENKAKQDGSGALYPFIKLIPAPGDDLRTKRPGGYRSSMHKNMNASGAGDLSR